MIMNSVVDPEGSDEVDASSKWYAAVFG